MISLSAPIPSSNITTIAFDADDTLWHNENFFREVEDRFAELLSDEIDSEALHLKLVETEGKNLKYYGYGVKGFTLSMLETALDVTHGRVSARVLGEIMTAGREMLAHPVEVFPGVPETLQSLAHNFRILIITKGDLLHQDSKIAESGLADLCHATEIVSEKTTETYRDLFARHGTGANQALMVGNSLKSDVIPALESGAWGVHIPYRITWTLEQAMEPQGFDRYRKLETLPNLLKLLS